MTPPVAHCLIRDQPVYRREAFMRGLHAAGFSKVHTGREPIRGRQGDALVIWNRYGETHNMAERFAQEGGSVFVTENAYVGVDRNDRRRYAVALEKHNGGGFWYYGGEERWEALGIALAPYREAGEHILVCPNRSFGTPGNIMPHNWPEEVCGRLSRFTKRPVRVRKHPGNDPHKTPIAEDLRNAWAVVIWSSSVGCEALIAGVPVFCEANWWIAKAATLKDIRRIDAPGELPDRLPALQRLAWAQWSVEEIERGEPFQHLLNKPSAFCGGL